MAIDFSKITKKLEESVKKINTSPKTAEKNPTDNVKNNFRELFNSTNKNTLEEIETSFIEASKELGFEEEEEEDVALDGTAVAQTTNTEATPEEIKDIASNFSTGEVFEVPGENKAYIKTGDGRYEQLDISMETYEKLFSEESQETNNLRPPTPNFDIIPQGEEPDVLSTILDNPDSRYNILKCFSEDEEGNIAVVIPNTEHGIIFSKRDIEKYSGNEMLIATYNSLLQQHELSQNELSLEYMEQNILENPEKFPPEYMKQTEAIFQYAVDNNISFSYIYSAFIAIEEGHFAEDQDIFEHKTLNEMISNLPIVESGDIVLNCLDAAEQKINVQNSIKLLEKTPIDAKELRSSPEYFLSSFGLDINGMPISDEAYAQAQAFIEYADWGESMDYNANIIAAYLNNNPYGEEILNAVMSHEELAYNPQQITLLLEKGFEENVDGDFLVKAASLNWPPSNIFRNNSLTPENIDLAVLFNKYYDHSQNIPASFAFRSIKMASEYGVDNELLEKSIKNGTYTRLDEAYQYVREIIPSYQNDGTTRSELLSEDISLIYQAVLEGKDIADLVVPTTASVEEGMENARIGDIFEVDGEKFIYIKTADGEYEQLDISKETYMELFPPVQRYMSSQGRVGDCYLVSSLNNMMTDPTTRHVLLQCFSEDEDGNVTVDLPNGDYSFTVEKGKTVLDYLPETMTLDTGNVVSMEFSISDSSLGMQMLELCYGIYLKDEALEGQMDTLERLDNMLLEEETYLSGPKEIEEANEFVNFIDEYVTAENMQWVGYLLEDLPYMQNESATFNAISSALNCSDEDVINEFMRLYQDYTENDYSMPYLKSLMRKDTTEEIINSLEADPYGTLQRDEGGWMHDVYTAFGFECNSLWDPGKVNDLDLDSSSSSSTPSLIDLVENPNVKIVAGGTYGTSDSKMLNVELNIAQRHAYTIYPVQQENGEWLFEVINPWDEARTSILTEEQIYEYFSCIDYIVLEK